METSFGCVIVFVIVTSGGSRSAPCKGAQILLAAEMVAEPWFMAGGLIPQERVQGCTVEKTVDEFSAET